MSIILGSGIWVWVTIKKWGIRIPTARGHWSLMRCGKTTGDDTCRLGTNVPDLPVWQSERSNEGLSFADWISSQSFLRLGPCFAYAGQGPSRPSEKVINGMWTFTTGMCRGPDVTAIWAKCQYLLSNISSGWSTLSSPTHYISLDHHWWLMSVVNNNEG